MGAMADIDMIDLPSFQLHINNEAETDPSGAGAPRRVLLQVGPSFVTGPCRRRPGLNLDHEPRIGLPRYYGMDKPAALRTRALRLRNLARCSGDDAAQILLDSAEELELDAEFLEQNGQADKARAPRSGVSRPPPVIPANAGIQASGPTGFPLSRE